MKQSGETPGGLTYGLVLIWGLSVLGWTPASATAVPAHPNPTKAVTTPLSFEVNVGQFEPPVRYLARGPGYGVFFTPTETVLVLQRSLAPSHTDARVVHSAHPPASIKEKTLRLQFVGNEVRPTQPKGQDQLPGLSHYFRGNDPTRWYTHVPQYARVVYEDLYPGIDLIYYGRGHQLEYDLVVAAGADPGAIELQVTGVESITKMPDGSLRLETAVGDLRQHPPVIYQEQNGLKHMIAGSYRVADPNRITFEIAPYDSRLPLYIDPVLSYATYFESDGVYSITQDGAGNLYLTGAAIPSTPTTVDSFQTTHNGFRDAFVTKLDPTGTTVLYSTFLGGSRDDLGRDIAVDATGNASVVGISSSTDFPTKSAIPDTSSLQENNAGSYDVVLARLSPNGDNLEYSTYLGGSGEDGLRQGLGLALDAQGNAYVSGTTNSKNFPTEKPLQATLGGEMDAFVAKVQGDGSKLLFGTYLGGSNSDLGGDVGVDGTGLAYVVGTTFSADFPTMNPRQQSLAGASDIFISKLTAEGEGLVYSTYLGGAGQDEGRGLAVDSSGQVFLTGYSQSSDYPVVDKEEQPAFQGQLAGSADVVVSLINDAGAELVYSTYVGGTEQDQGVGIALDPSGQAYVTGWTTSENFPVTGDAPQPRRGIGRMDAFVLKLNADGTSRLYATYLGGDGDDVGQAITVDNTESAYVVGTSSSSDFPRTAPLQAVSSGGFVAELSETGPPQADLAITMGDAPESVERGTTLTYKLTITNQGPETANDVRWRFILTALFRLESILTSQGPGCMDEEEDLVCRLGTLEKGGKATITMTGRPLVSPSILTNRTSVFSELPDPDWSNNIIQIHTDVTTPEGGPTADLSLVRTDNTETITIGAPFSYTLTVTNHGPDTVAHVNLTETIPPEASVGTATSSQGMCAGDRKLSCILGSLQADTKATVTIEVIPTTTETLASSARVTSSATDPNTSADLSVSLDGPPTPIKEGEVQTYTTTVMNNGPDPAENVVLVNNLLTNPVRNFIDAEITKGECKIPEDLNEDDPLVLRCDIGILDVKIDDNDENEVILTLKVTLTANPMVQTIVAGVESSTFDPNEDNNAQALAVVVEASNPPPQGGDSGCFIATAAFDSPLAKEVQILRHFRDRFLLTNLAGQILVRGYYFSSPPLANFIDQHPELKKTVRVALWPVVWWAHLTLTSPNLAFLALIGGFLLILTLLYWMIRSWQHKIGT